MKLSHRYELVFPSFCPLSVLYYNRTARKKLSNMKSNKKHYNV